MDVLLEEREPNILWSKIPAYVGRQVKNGVRETIPRHTEIDNVLVKKICGKLEIPSPFEGH